jgi:glyoxylase-like metal-dependent hydrolase (beta-lactamase superfamily II)
MTIHRGSLLIVALLLAPFASAQMVAENITVQLGPHTYAIPDQMVGGVPNVGIIVGDRATLVIDPGLGRRNGEAILREVAKISDNTEFYFASTHFHPEHTTGYVAFPDSALYVNSRVQETEFSEAGPGIIELFSDRSFLMSELLGDFQRRLADITFERQYSLDLGGVTVHMLVVGPTHTVGDTGFFIEEDGVLFSGDVVMNNSFVSASKNSSLSAWLAAFDSFEAMGASVIVPSHGDIGGASLIPTLRTVFQQIQTRAIALNAQGISAEETAATIQMEMENQHPGWARANGVSALAYVAWQDAEEETN